MYRLNRKRIWEICAIRHNHNKNMGGGVSLANVRDDATLCELAR